MPDLAERSQAGKSPISKSDKFPLATVLAFSLCVICCSALGYGTYRFFDILTFSPASSHDVVFQLRGGIYALSVITGIACVMLGFATFMIGGRGEFKVESESAALKGMMR